MGTFVLSRGLRAMMTREEADRIVNESEKTIGERIVWRLDNQRRQKYRFRVPVICDDVLGQIFLMGQAGPPNKWGFVLLGPSGETLRKISAPHDGHRHPDQTTAGRYHKHYHTGERTAVWTYEPDDIRWDDFNRALLDFAAECRITFLYTPEPLLFSSGLERHQEQP
jgi:hypothetical protein